MSPEEPTENEYPHDWIYTGLDTHRGEYWYRCSKCYATDWIASYGTADQLLPKFCKKPSSDDAGRN